MQKSELSRGQFLKELGMGSKALMAFYCMGSLTSCSSDDAPNPDGNTNNGGNTDGGSSGIIGTSTGSSIDFTIDLTHKNFSKLKTDGGFEYAGDIIIVNTGSQNYIALSKSCTHQGTKIEYRSGSNDFRCPNHGSLFSTNGTVTKDPASAPLTVFKTVLGENKNTLKVSA